MHHIAIGAAGLALIASPEAATAQAAALDIRSLGAGTAVLMGQDGNVVILAGPEGALLIDAERSRDVPEMQAAVRTLTERPVRYVINTHWHLDHVGGNAAFGEAGATVIAHRNVQVRLASEQYMAAYDARIPAQPPEAWPDVMFEGELTVRFAGETVRLKHTPAAHTDGDALVRLEAANVLHMGDVFFNGMFPFIDRSSGGGIEGLIAAVDAGLAMSDDQTRIVPAHGEIADRKTLLAWREMLQTVADAVKARQAKGESLETVLAAGLTAAWALEGDAPRFVAAVYDSYANP